MTSSRSAGAAPIILLCCEKRQSPQLWLQWRGGDPGRMLWLQAPSSFFHRNFNIKPV